MQYAHNQPPASYHFNICYKFNFVLNFLPHIHSNNPGERQNARMSVTVWGVQATGKGVRGGARNDDDAWNILN